MVMNNTEQYIVHTSAVSSLVLLLGRESANCRCRGVDGPRTGAKSTRLPVESTTDFRRAFSFRVFAEREYMGVQLGEFYGHRGSSKSGVLQQYLNLLGSSPSPVARLPREL